MNIKELLKLVGQGRMKVKSKGGGGSSTPPPAPPPPPPSRWWYDKNGDAQEYRPMNEGIPTDRYISPNAAAEANPKVWLYDSSGESVRQVFKVEAQAGNYDKSLNLGPKSVPYRHWYDTYGVSQRYAPVDTPIGAGYYESPTQAPKSPNYKQAVALNEVKGNLVAQGESASTPADLAAVKVQAQKRKQKGQTSRLTVLGDGSVGEEDDGKSVTGE